MNTSESSYTEKVDSIFAIIRSYEYEPESESQEKTEGNNNSENNDTDKNCNDVSSGSELTKAAELALQIEQQVKGMHLQIESATVQIELLHGLRASEEANHSAAMKALQTKWETVLKDHKEKQDIAISEQEQTIQNAAKHHKALKKEEASLKMSLERIISLERDACKKLQEDGAAELEKAKSNWMYAERNEFQKREQKLIPKIKKEAAKTVESKLRKLKERHDDEIRSLERETARELQSYKLELYRNSQQICKNERRKVEASEKRLMDKVEREWLQKLEEARSENCTELTVLKKTHEDEMKALRMQHEADRKRRLEKQEADMIEAKALMEESLAQQRQKNDAELKVFENKCNNELTLRKGMIQKELEQWKMERLCVLQEEEDRKVDLEYKRFEAAVKKDIERCKMATSSN